MNRVKTYSLLVILVELATKTVLVVDLVLQTEGIVLQCVASLDLALGSLVFLGKFLSLGNHAVNLLLRQAALVVGDGDGLRLASALVAGADPQDTVGIEVEGDLNLGDATRSRGNTGQLELAQQVVVLGHGALSLVDLDQHGGLVVGRRREDLGLASGDNSVTRDQLGHDTASGLNAQGKRIDIHENNLRGSLLTGKDTTLDGGTEGDGLIGVDTLAGLLATEELLEESLDLGNTGRTTDKNNVVDVGLLNLGILQNLLDGLQGALEQIHVQLLKLGTSQGLGEVLALVESFDFNAGRHLGRQSTFGLLNLTLQLTHGLQVLGDVDIVLLVV